MIITDIGATDLDAALGLHQLQFGLRQLQLQLSQLFLQPILLLVQWFARCPVTAGGGSLKGPQSAEQVLAVITAHYFILHVIQTHTASVGA